MCEYCGKIINNKKILDIDNEEETHMEIINQKKSWGYMLYVEIEGQDNDGYKPSQFFQINYCPMCGRKLIEQNEDDLFWKKFIQEQEKKLNREENK